MLFNWPADPRSMMELFAFYSKEGSLEELMQLIDFKDACNRRLYYSVFGQAPDPDEAPERESNTPAEAYIIGLLESDRFQSELLSYVLDAYPEKKRLIFVHIPKCAGTDLRMHLEERFPALAASSAIPRRISKETLFDQLSRLVLELRFSDTIFVHGHLRLGLCLGKKMIRPSDRAITVLRKPEDIVVSHINFVLSQIVRGHETGNMSPDGARWESFLREDDLSTEMLATEPATLFREMVRNPKFTRNNRICYVLGKGDAQSAIANARISDIEMTTLDSYNQWTSANWNITAETTKNKSRKFFSRKEIDPADLKYIDEITSEDQKFYGFIHEAIEKAGTLSIRGSRLEPKIEARV